MTKETYIKMTQPFRERPEMAKGIHIANKICTGIMYISYPLLILYMFFEKSDAWLSAVLVPAVSMVILSLARYFINRPRPYEAFEVPPVIPKDTKGKSFPSRHVFAATVISMTFLLVSPLPALGIVYLVVSLCLGVIRVLSGVHYPSDVIAGVLTGLAFTIIGFIIL